MSKPEDLAHVSPDFRAWQRGELMPAGMRSCVAALVELIEEAAAPRPADEYIGDLFEWRADWSRRAEDEVSVWRSLTAKDET
jgi:hypothetical protein